jgi:hypothetical protein
MDFIRNLLGKKKKASTPSSRDSAKINLFVGGTPPPGAVVFKSDGTIDQTPDSPQARHEWTVQKMTLKIEKDPYDGEWYFERGKALMALGRYPEAASDFSMLIDFYNSDTCYRLRGLCYYHAGDRARALADLRRYKELCDVSRLEPETVKILSDLEGS